MKTFILKVKLSTAYFLLLLIGIGLTCYLEGKPLVFVKDKYGLLQVVDFSILVGILSVGFVFIVLPILTWVKKKIFPFSEFVIFHIVGSVALLIIGFIAMGFVEALLTKGEIRPFYYFDCVTNSCIYIFYCIGFSIPIARHYAKTLVKTIQKDSIQASLDELGKE